MATYKELSNGSSGSDVKKLQQALLDAGYDLGSYGADGVYGNATAAAVKKYQQDNGLKVDGIAGNQTLGSLYTVKAPEAAPQVPTTTTTPAITAPLDMSQFTYDPGTNDAYQQALAALQQAQSQTPTYKGTYDQQLADLYNQITNREKFTYDLNADALYQQYKGQYMQGGKMAMMDTMGQAAALTGGYGNSYAQGVGQQAYQGYLQQLNNVIPELYGMALDQYNQEGDRMVQQYSMLGDMADTEYGRYQDDLNQYWQNLTFQKQQADDAYAQGFDNWYNAYKNAYTANRDQVADQQWQAQFDEAKRQYDQEYAFAQQQYADSQQKSTSSNSSSPSVKSNYDPEVAALQEQLNALGANLEVDGIRGPLTEAAYEKYMGSGAGFTGKTYSEAVAYMTANGVPNAKASNAMTQSEWQRVKNSGSSRSEVNKYDSYQEWLADYVAYAIEEYGK